MKEPFVSDDKFLAELDEVQRRAGILDLWWLGQSGFLIQHREQWILTDPYLSDSLTTKYAQTDKPHVRLTRRVVDPARLARQTVSRLTVTSSHSHTDHLDPGTLRPLTEAGAILSFVVPASTAQLAYERSFATSAVRPPHFVSLDDGETTGIKVQITAVASAHETVERDAAGRCKYLGYVFEFTPSYVNSTGSMWRLEKEWTVYHSGDTVLYDGLVDRLRPFKVDIALLPINGRSPERRVAGNLNGREAAWLAKEIGARLVIPCHYDMFEFNTADPRDEFIPECQRLGQPYRVLRLGERFSSSELAPITPTAG